VVGVIVGVGVEVMVVGQWIVKVFTNKEEREA
jgi:hypothetical protein